MVIKLFSYYCTNVILFSMRFYTFIIYIYILMTGSIYYDIKILDIFSITYLDRKTHSLKLEVRLISNFAKDQIDVYQNQ